MADLQDIVARGVGAHKALDRAMVAALKASDALEEIYREAVGAGLFKINAAKEAVYKAHIIGGKLAEAGLVAAELHTEATKAAKAASVDTGTIDEVGGVTVLGGPGR